MSRSVISEVPEQYFRNSKLQSCIGFFMLILGKSGEITYLETVIVACLDLIHHLVGFIIITVSIYLVFFHAAD